MRHNQICCQSCTSQVIERAAVPTQLFQSRYTVNDIVRWENSTFRGLGNSRYGFLVALSFFKTDFPWVYDLGKELSDVLKSKSSKEIKVDAVNGFREMMDFTFQHPIMREIYG